MNHIKPKSKLRTILKWVGWFFLVQFVLINISAALYAYKLTHFYHNGETTLNPSSNFLAKTWKLFTGPKFYKTPASQKPSLPFQTIQLTTANGSNFECWYIPKDSAKGTVILFHGLSNSKSILLAEANGFYELGYQTLLVDFRGHGNSSGNTTCYGAVETEEVKLAYDFIHSREEKNIILYGLSMGAVVVAKAFADYSIQPSKIILEAPFENLRCHLRGRARMLGFPAEPFATLVCFWIGVERDFNGFKLNTAAYAKKITCPVLLQYGTEDKYVTRKETDNIFNAIASEKKKLALHENIGHELFIHRNPDEWKNEVENFLESR
ncbi:MAG: hypothetical protein C4308_09170 [Chitinophagaceae bacterium]